MQNYSSILDTSSIGGILLIIINSISVICGLSVFIYLYKNKEKFPYTHISSLWERFLIMMTILCQITECILIFTSNLAMTINFYFCVPVVFIVMIARSFSIGQCITFNSTILSTTFNIEIKKEENENIMKKNFYKRKFLYLYHFLLIIIIYCLFFFCLFGSCKEQLIQSMSSYETNAQETKEQSDSIDTNLSIGPIVYFLLIGIVTFMIVRIIRYPLKIDKFKFFVEFWGLLLILFVFIDIKTPVLLLLFFEKNQRTIAFFLFDSLFYFIVILLYGILAYLRHKHFNFQEDYLEFQDFHYFMERKYTFQLFSDYVKKNYLDQYKLLCFWADCIVYKKNAAAAKRQHKIIMQKKKSIIKKNARKLSDDVTLSSNEEILISQNEERIKAQAKNLFLQYFGNSVSYNQSDSNTKSCLILIDFPIDIYEKAEEMFKNNYTTDNLENVFNDSLSWISAELEKLFKIYITDVDEKKKMEKILFFLDCFEI